MSEFEIDQWYTAELNRAGKSETERMVWHRVINGIIAADRAKREAVKSLLRPAVVAAAIDPSTLIGRVKSRRGADSARRLRGERPQDDPWPWIHEGELIAEVERLTAALPVQQAAWQSHSANNTMRHPEEADLTGGATDMPVQQARVPDGYRLVPVEPTAEMVHAIPWPENVTPHIGIETYRAMLAAAPTPPVPAPTGPTATAPERIWLQVSEDEYDGPFPADHDATWCAESIGGTEVQYVRADLVPTPPVQQDAACHGHIHTCTPPEPCDHHWSDPTKMLSKLTFCWKCGTLQKDES